MTTTVNRDLLRAIARVLPEAARLSATPRDDGSFDVSVASGHEAALSSAVAAGIKPGLKSYAAERRYAFEVGGCTWNGWPVATDRESQNKLLAEFVAIGGGLRTDGAKWKFADGVFRSLTNTQAAAMITAARTHIATAFETEDQVIAAIDAGTVTSTAQIDEEWF